MLVGIGYAWRLVGYAWRLVGYACRYWLCLEALAMLGGFEACRLVGLDMLGYTLLANARLGSL